MMIQEDEQKIVVWKEGNKSEKGEGYRGKGKGKESWSKLKNREVGTIVWKTRISQDDKGIEQKDHEIPPSN